MVSRIASIGRAKPGVLLLAAALLLTTAASVRAGVTNHAEPGAFRVALSVEPRDLVANEAAFRPFAEAVMREVERLLREPAAIDDAATLRALLSVRVHLALHLRDNEKAAATAAWIRSLQTEATARAFAGLTTFALLDARRSAPERASADPRFRTVFRDAFAARLAALPRSAEMARELRSQREKIAALSDDALVAEERSLAASRRGSGGSCGFEEADRLVRIRHRRVNILPLKAELLSALDAAIAARAEITPQG